MDGMEILAGCFLIGKESIKSKKLVEVTYQSMWEGIKKVKKKTRKYYWRHRSCYPKKYAESLGYSVVKDFCGHGIGQVFHCAPNILHYGEPR